MPFVFALIFFLSFQLEAATRSILLPEQALIVIQTVNMKTGEVDSDPHELWDNMTAPAKPGPSGDDGKLVESPDGKFILTCVERKATGARQCQVIVRKSSRSKINSILGTTEYAAKSDEISDFLAEQFIFDEGSFQFSTSDGKLQIFADYNEFRLVFAEH